jgi:MFS superfamily sulfate permease-like transporter
MKKRVFPISMTVLWGIVFTTAMHNLTLGICMGLMMGIAFGLFDSDKKDKQEQGNDDVN